MRMIYVTYKQKIPYNFSQTFINTCLIEYTFDKVHSHILNRAILRTKLLGIFVLLQGLFESVAQ